MVIEHWTKARAAYWVTRNFQVAQARASGKTYREVSELFGLSLERVRQIWLAHLRWERKKCRGCRPEPLAIDMEGMRVTMWFVRDDVAQNP